MQAMRSALRPSLAKFCLASGGLFAYGVSRAEPSDAVVQTLPITKGKKDHHKYTLRNQLWTEEELKKRYETCHQHEEPKNIMDSLTYGFLRVLYTSFNTITFFDKNDPTASSLRTRIILLESIAGVPPFIMAGYRYFRSLRNCDYDGGRIYTHLEEAENERMHLITAMQIFGAGRALKAAVYVLQIITTPVCWFFCLLNPRFLNRFVGYLEELACETYSTVLKAVNDPTKKLYHEWHDLKAPPVAIEYWDLPEGATWPDTIRRIYADETVHRDVNHTFANIAIDAANPLLEKHIERYQRSLKRS